MPWVSHRPDKPARAVVSKIPPLLAERTLPTNDLRMTFSLAASRPARKTDLLRRAELLQTIVRGFLTFVFGFTTASDR
jgi:hypothetical protein